MTSPLKVLDDLIEPIILAANAVRQVRDALPEALWQLVPLQLRAPIDALFAAAEAYDRKVGLLRDVGLMGD